MPPVHLPVEPGNMRREGDCLLIEFMNVDLFQWKSKRFEDDQVWETRLECESVNQDLPYLFIRMHHTQILKPDPPPYPSSHPTAESWTPQEHTVGQAPHSSVTAPPWIWFREKPRIPIKNDLQPSGVYNLCLNNTINLWDVWIMCIFGCFLKRWYPQSIRFNRVFPKKKHPFWGTIILGNPYL